MLKLLSDYRFTALLLALLAMAALFAFPTRQQDGPIYRLTFVIDITRSMNAEDYTLAGQPVSRLTFVKHRMNELIRRLPCGSEVGLGVFTERRSTLLFEPVEVCSAYSELEQSIKALDWRMAWAADSRIAGGLSSALQLMQGKNAKLVFVSDGQEAPPANSRYRSDFSLLKGKVAGLILGSGGLQAVPIPKFDETGRRIGHYGPDDVPHRSSFGISDLNPEQIEGYDARNAPFGKHAASGSEHLSALQEAYLQELAGETGLSYRRLSSDSDLLQLVESADLAINISQAGDIRPWYALAALVMLLIALA